jgi:hypothetical protein
MVEAGTFMRQLGFTPQTVAGLADSVIDAAPNEDEVPDRGVARHITWLQCAAVLANSER